MKRLIRSAAPAFAPISEEETRKMLSKAQTEICKVLPKCLYVDNCRWRPGQLSIDVFRNTKGKYSCGRLIKTFSFAFNRTCGYTAEEQFKYKLDKFLKMIRNYAYILANKRNRQLTDI